jgi:hypothetical protein
MPTTTWLSDKAGAWAFPAATKCLSMWTGPLRWIGVGANVSLAWVCRFWMMKTWPSYRDGRARMEGLPRWIETISSHCDVGPVCAQALVEGTGRSPTKARPLPWTLGVSSTWGKRDCCNSFPCGGQGGSVGSHYDVELDEMKYVLRNQQIWCVQKVCSN